MPTICCHGTNGAKVRPAGETRVAASPISWTQCTTARRKRRSASRSRRPRPRENDRASVAASSMWRMRIRSSAKGSGGIEGPRLGEYVVAEVAGQVAGRPKVNVSAEDLAQFHQHSANVEEAGADLGQELDQHVDVA